MSDQDDHFIESAPREPWNKGRLIGHKRPLRPKDVWAIRVRLEIGGQGRDLALFNLALLVIAALYVQIECGVLDVD
jgi:hypothetical protein